MSLSRFVLPSIVALGAIASACGGGDAAPAEPTSVATTVAAATTAPTATATVETTPEKPSNVVRVTEETPVYSEPRGWGYVLAMIPAGVEVTVTGRIEEPWVAIEGFGWVEAKPGSEFAAADAPAVEMSDVIGLLHPSDVRTGVEFVDVVIAALVAEDRAALAELLVFAELECAVDWMHSAQPKCPEGVADGTPVETFEHTADGRRFATLDLAGWAIEELLGAEGSQLAAPAVYAVQAGMTASDFDLPWAVPAAPYEIVLRLSDGQVHQVKVSERGIEWAGMSGRVSPPAWTIYPMGDEPVDYLLAPRVPVPLVPVPMVAAQ